MNKSKCPKCGSAHTKRNGKRNGTQTYKCCECGCQFRSERLLSDEELWQIYQSGKQTISELSELYGVSPSTIKRRLRSITIEWENPPLERTGERNSGINGSDQPCIALIGTCRTFSLSRDPIVSGCQTPTTK